MKAVRAVLVRADGEHTYTDVVGGLDALQRLVGGYVEAVNFADGVHAYCAEDGKLRGAAVNELATRVAEALRPGFASFDFLVGDVVFLGTSGDDEADCPTHIWDLVCRTAAKVGIPFGGPA